MIIIFLYLISALIFTYPLILNIGSALPGQPGDAFVYLWNIGNFWQQLLYRNNPFISESVMYPIGANLFFHTYAPIISVIAYPFKENLSGFMGTAVIVSVFLSCISCYLLIHKITLNKVAAFLGGLTYGISSIVYSFIQSQHYYFLFAAIFYPLGILFLINFFETRKYKFLYMSISLFWVVITIDYYSAVLYALLIIVFFIFNENVNFENLAKTILAGLLVLIFPFVIIYNFESNFREFINFKQTYNSSSSCNTNLAGFITPNTNNPILGKFATTINDKTKTEVNLDTPTYFIGWGILIIMLISMFKYSKDKYMKSIIFIFILFFVLSLGTNIRFGNASFLSGPHTPFYYFLKIPILGAIDCPIRFPVIMQICVSVFVAIFVSKHKRLIKPGLAILLLILVEYAVVNKDFSSTEVPQVYKYLSTKTDNKTVLEIPSGITESKGAFGYDWSIRALHSQQMYWQTFYKKPRVGVYMSRLRPEEYEFFKSEPVISDIFNFSNAGGTKPTHDIDESIINFFIHKFNLGYIILSPNTRQSEFSEFIEYEFETKVSNKNEFDGFIIYELR